MKQSVRVTTNKEINSFFLCVCAYLMSSYVLESLQTKEEIDDAILNTVDLVLVLRFGRETDATCMQLDDLLSKSQHELKKMARICIVDVDRIPQYVKYFDITLIPATVFFFNAVHMKCDFRLYCFSLTEFNKVPLTIRNGLDHSTASKTLLTL